MKRTQKLVRNTVVALTFLVLGTTLATPMSAIAATPMSTLAVEQTGDGPGGMTWQQFVKKQCPPSDPAHEERCRQSLVSYLKQVCGASNKTAKYTTCRQRFINSYPNVDVGTLPGSGGSSIAKADDPALKGKFCTSSDCPIISKYLNPFIRLLTALVGVVVVIAVIVGGIEFASAAGDPQKVASGKKHIINALIALVAFIFLFAFLQFLIPGGIV